MARIFIQRLEKKYGKENIKGRKYQEMISEILAENNQKVGNAVGRLSKQNYETQMKKLSAKKATTVKLPDVSEVLPKRSVYLIKAAQSGRAISDDLRASLERNLRQTLEKYTEDGGPRLEIKRGRTTGRINRKLIDDFQAAITETYKSRTKKDKGLGVPKNIKQIATTETRSVVSAIKREYNQRLTDNNPSIIMVKIWVQNRVLAKKPRSSHAEQDGRELPMNQLFKVRREQSGGFDNMHGPYDPQASAENVIGCNCDLLYKARIPG